MTTVRRKPVSTFLRNAQDFLFHKDEAAQAGAVRDDAKKQVRTYLESDADDVYEDEKKNRYVDFPAPVEINGVKYSGMKLQRNVTPTMDTDAAEELLDTKGLTPRVRQVVETVVWDWDELYVLNQEGLITDTELDALMDKNVTWAVWPVKE